MEDSYLFLKFNAILYAQNVFYEQSAFTFIKINFIIIFRNHVYGMGVADGVHMWREQGIDAGQYSRTLMDAAKNQITMG